jgi:hypothetical protein
VDDDGVVSQVQESVPSPLQHARPSLSVVLAAGAVGIIAVCLFLAVRYPNVPHMTPPPDYYHGGELTNLFGRRVAIAVFGSAIAIAVGIMIIMRRPTRAAVRILTFGVPAVAIAAALLMPVAIGPSPCPAILCQMYEPRLYEVPARLSIAALGGLGGLYLWTLGRRALTVATDRR